jgi:hypothetical protein
MLYCLIGTFVITMLWMIIRVFHTHCLVGMTLDTQRWVFLFLMAVVEVNAFLAIHMLWALQRCSYYSTFIANLVGSLS